MASSGAALAQDASKAQDEEERVDAKRFEVVLQSAMVGVLAAGTATLQARQLLVTQTATPLGEEAVLAASGGLARAYSLGSLAELFLSPSFGRFSERFGRKPVLLSLLVGPACMRSLCVAIKQPSTRIRMLCLDFASARVIGVQPMIAIAQTMISDMFPKHLQAAAQSRLKAASALGQIIGNYASGWWNARAGPQSTYVVTAAIPMMCFAYLSACLPETNRGTASSNKALQGRPQGEATPTEASAAATPVAPAKRSGAFRTVFCDPECCLLAATLGLYEFMTYPPMNTVSIFFMKERLGWGPLQAGRFASGVALSTFSGSMLAAWVKLAIERIVGDALGGKLFVSLAHCLTSLAYVLWGTAQTGRQMVACLLPLALGAGANPMVLTRFYARAESLGLSRGEAAGVNQAIGAAGRMVAPQLFLRLWLWAAAQRDSKAARARLRLPLGSPMLAVALVALAQEALHQGSWFARASFV
mmetsp:Transcript_85696/g.239500  ORF Transcript_85696/g.239500 Transcript_85696/m.239500 type:complete len:474 (+) Transcript_85696:62-1483(+)